MRAAPSVQWFGRLAIQFLEAPRIPMLGSVVATLEAPAVLRALEAALAMPR